MVVRPRQEKQIARKPNHLWMQNHGGSSVQFILEGSFGAFQSSSIDRLEQKPKSVKNVNHLDRIFSSPPLHKGHVCAIYWPFQPRSEILDSTYLVMPSSCTTNKCRGVFQALEKIPMLPAFNNVYQIFAYTIHLMFTRASISE